VTLRDELAAVAAGVGAARQEPYSAHPLAQRITGAWKGAAAETVGDLGYLIVGSAGKGNWARTVWLAFFDRMVTESAQRKFYLVYLIPGDGGRIYLSLNQGTTEIHERVGARRYLGVLADTATRDVGLLSKQDTLGLLSGPLELGGEGMLTKGYEAGNIFAIEYDPGDLPSDDEVDGDLARMLLLYQSLVEGRGQVDAEGQDDPLGGQAPSGLEAGCYAWHRRAERSRGLAKAAKKIHGTVCQVEACGKDLTAIYGELAEGYIEAHHLTPFASLDGRPTELDPTMDFAVVCPDCHRMLHRRSPEPFTLEELSEILLAAESKQDGVAI
jgi:5-methylcytosine-specific restriction protein A